MALYYKLLLSFKSIPNVFPPATLFTRFFYRAPWWNVSPLLVRLLFELSCLSPPLGRIPHPLASGLRAGGSNGWWVKALRPSKVEWSEPGDGSKLFRGLSWMILQLLAALAEAVVWLHAAGSWAGLEGAGLTHVSDPSVLRHMCLSLGRLAWASLQHGDWLPRGRK